MEQRRKAAKSPINVDHSRSGGGVVPDKGGAP
jgi:hypothetical protein